MRHLVTLIETSTELLERRYFPLRKLNCLNAVSFEFLGESLLGERNPIAIGLEAVERASLLTFFAVEESKGKENKR